MGNVLDNRVINPLELVKFSIIYPSAIGTSGNDDIYSWDQTVNPYGRDKIEEHKINTLVPRKYGAILSWLAADSKDEDQTDGIAASEAIEKAVILPKQILLFF